MAGEVEVIAAVDGNKVKMGMWNFQSYDGKPTAIAFKGLLDRPGDWLGKDQHFGQIFFRHIEEFIDLCFGDDQGVAFPERKNIQEGIEPIVFRNFVGRDLPCDDL